MSVAFDIATYLDSLDICGDIGENIRVNTMDEMADSLTAVFETPGAESTKTHGGAVAFEHPNIDIWVRDLDPEAAHSTCYTIQKALDGAKDVTVNGHEYLYMRCTSTTGFMGRDQKERAAYRALFRVERRPEA